MVLWESKSCTVKELGTRLYLDSGTLTPLLKRLESEGFITRQRSVDDERSLIVTITAKGEELKLQAVHIPTELACLNKLTPQENAHLYSLLYKLLRP